VKPRVRQLAGSDLRYCRRADEGLRGLQGPALFTRMPHYFLSTKDSVVETPFDAYEFPVKNGTQRVEGRHLHYTYDFDESAGTSPGFLQIVGVMQVPSLHALRPVLDREFVRVERRLDHRILSGQEVVGHARKTARGPCSPRNPSSARRQ